jgi:Fur family ferric uptake transcriptional regulator
MSWFSEQATEAIHKAGGRMTEPRQIIIDLLEHATEQLDVETMYQRVRERDSSISIATVYRTLNVLEAAGLVQQRYRSRDHERRYYEMASSETSYHFTCRVCRKVIPFKSNLVQELKLRLSEELGLTMLNACICLDGICPDCQTKIEREEVEAVQA